MDPSHSMDPLNRIDVAKLTNDLMHPCEGTLFFCSPPMQAAKELNEPFFCCDRRFWRIIYTAAYGPCHQIDWPEEMRRQQFAGPTWGFNIVGQIPVEDLAPIRRNAYLSSGIYLLIEPDKNNPLPTQAIAVSPGSHTQIGLKFRKERLIPSVVEVFSPPCRKNATLNYVLGKQ